MDKPQWELVQDLFFQAVDLKNGQLDSFIQSLSQHPDDVADEVLKMIDADRRKTHKTTKIQREIEKLKPNPSVQIPAIDGYDIIELIAHGGMGSVYKAFDHRLSRTVAIKVLHPYLSDQPKFKQRFMREARAAARIQHENINTIYEISESEQGQIHIASAYCEGTSLLQHIRSNSLSLEQILLIMRQLASALEAAHRQGVVHRDLKPENIIINDRFGLKLVDFGIAKIRDEHQTSTGEIIGTPAYMSPEQFRGEAIDPLTDIWASGMILYEMLEGNTPYDNKSAPEIIYSMLHESVPYTLSKQKQYAPLYEVVQQCLSIDKSMRPTSAEILHQQLLKALAQLKSSELYRSIPEYPATTQPNDSHSHPSIATHKNVLLLHLFGENKQLTQSDRQQAADFIRKYRGQLVNSPLPPEHVYEQIIASFGYPQADERTRHNGLMCALSWVEYGTQQSAKYKAFASYQQFDDLPHSIHTTLPSVTELYDGQTLFVFKQSRSGVWVDRKLFEVLPEPLFQAGEANAQEIAKGCFPVEKRQDTVHHPFTVQLSPFTGRDSQLGILQEYWQQALEGGFQRVLISGEAGIGKSRLIYELKQDLDNSQPIRLIELACSPYEQSSTYFPVLSFLRQQLAQQNDNMELDYRCIHNYLHNLLQPEELDSLILCQLLGVGLSAEQATRLPSGDLLNRKYQSLLIRLLTAHPEGHTSLIIIEDLHWIDQATSLIIEQLLQPASTQSTFIVMSCRPEYKPAWLSNVVTSNLYLSKLRQTQSEKLLRELVDRTTSKDAQAANEITSDRLSQLAERTGGNPLFIEELAKSVSRSDNNVPGSIQDTLIAHLDKLGSARELAQIAAVIGRNFKRSLLRQCNSADQADFDQRFNTLVQAEIFYPSIDEDQWYFKHALIRDAAYQTLHDDSQRSLHGVIASSIEEHDAHTTQNQPSLLAQHWELNGNLSKAVSYWQKSAQRNLTLFAISESIEQCEHALQLSEQLGQDNKAQQLAIYTTLGPALMNRYGYADDRAGDAYARALELSKNFKGQVPIINIMFGNWTYRCVRAEHLSAYPLSQEMIRISEAAGVRSEICESYMVQGINDFYRGEFLDARKTLQTAIEHYDREDSVHHIVTYGQNPFIPINNFQSWNELALGEIEKAVQHATASVNHARETNHPMTLAYALSFATYVFMSIGDFVEAEKLVTESIRVCSENDVILFLGLSLILQALLFFNRNEIEAGEQAMARASEVYLPTGAQVMIPNFFAVQAEVLLKAGRLQEAEELINQALAILDQTRENWCLAPVQAIKCLVHKLKQESEIAEEFMHKLVDTLTYQCAEGIRMMLLQKGFEIPELEPQTN